MENEARSTGRNTVKKPADVVMPAVRTLRFHQWIKNVLVFVPLMLGGKSTDLSIWMKACIGFLAFGFTASGTYIINDLRDVRHDQKYEDRHKPDILYAEWTVKETNGQVVGQGPSTDT
jgi:4-hydroxybenzoate polyprenyltransferase